MKIIKVFKEKKRERENLFLFASQITIFFKKIKQRIVSNIAKNAANEKNTESNKTSEFNHYPHKNMISK